MKAADILEQYNCIDILERNLVDRADKVALYSPSRDMTFGQVAAEVNQVGNALRRLGVRFGDTVAILCLDRPEWVTSYFGTIKIGAIALSMIRCSNRRNTPSRCATAMRASSSCMRRCC